MVEVKENVVIRDWLTFTTKDFDHNGIMELLGMTGVEWTQIHGFYGYQDRLYFGGISIHYNGREDMGVCCEMSGQGCRTFEEYSDLPGKWDDLFAEIAYNCMHVTRLDVAYDDHTGVLDIDRIMTDVEDGNFVSLFRSCETVRSKKKDSDIVGKSATIGTRKSQILVRIYDKAVERGYTDGRHWVRVELQMKDQRAKAFLDSDLPLGETFAGVLLNYLRFVEPCDDSNKSRWSMAEYWANLLGNVQAISLYSSPGVDYNVEACRRYVVDMAGNAVACMIEISGGVEEFQTLIDRRTCHPNEKYEILIKENHARLENLARKAGQMMLFEPLELELEPISIKGVST